MPRFPSSIAPVLIPTLLLSAGCQGPDRRSQAFEPFNQVGMPLPMNASFKRYSPQSLEDMNKAMKGSTEKPGDPKYEVRRLYTEYCRLVGDGDVEAARQVRDRIAFKMMTHIKHYHEGQSDDVYEVTAGLEAFFDLTALAMTSAAAATGGAAAKTALSIAAAGVLGTKSTLGSSILADQTKFAIIEHMQAIRTGREADIIRRLNSQSVDMYPLEETVKDMYDFLSDGSLKAAVAELVQGAERARAEANAKLAEAESFRGTLGRQVVRERAGRISASSELLATTSEKLRASLAGTSAEALVSIGVRARSLSDAVATRLQSITAFENKSASLARAKSGLREAEAVLAAIKIAAPSRESEQPAAEAQVASSKAAVAVATTEFEDAQKALDATIAALEVFDQQLTLLQAEFKALTKPPAQ